MPRYLRIPFPTPLTFPTHARRQRDFTAAYQRTVGLLMRQAVARLREHDAWRRVRLTKGASEQWITAGVLDGVDVAVDHEKRVGVVAALTGHPAFGRAVAKMRRDAEAMRETIIPDPFAEST